MIDFGLTSRKLLFQTDHVIWFEYRGCWTLRVFSKNCAQKVPSIQQEQFILQITVYQSIILNGMQGLPWLGASIVTSVTFEYKNSSCSMFNGAASKTYQAADMTQTRIQTIRDPRLWTTGDRWSRVSINGCACMCTPYMAGHACKQW